MGFLFDVLWFLELYYLHWILFFDLMLEKSFVEKENRGSRVASGM